MIKLISTLFEKEISLDTSKFFTIVIENKSVNYDVCKYLYDDFRSNTDYFKIFEEDKRLEISSEAAFIFNLFSLDLNTKRNINALYRLLKRISSNCLENNIKEIRDSILEMVKQISLDLEIELDVNNQVKEEDLFKIVDLRFSESDSSNLLRLKKYIETMYELSRIKIFFIYHLHDYFEKEDINILFHELSYKNISIFDIEQSSDFEKADNEQIIIIDRDLCTIE